MTTDFDASIYFEAVRRAKAAGNPDAEGADFMKYIDARSKYMDIIKKERADAKHKEELKKLQPEQHKELAIGDTLDTSPPPEPPTSSSPTRVWSREELQNVIKYLDSGRIVCLQTQYVNKMRESRNKIHKSNQLMRALTGNGPIAAYNDDDMPNIERPKFYGGSIDKEASDKVEKSFKLM